MRSAVITIIAVLFILLVMPIVGQETSIRHTHVYLNIRSGPGTSFDKVGLARPCTNIEVIEAAAEWLKIKHGDGEAYVAGWFTHTGEPHCDSVAALNPAQTGSTTTAPAATPEQTQPGAPAQDNKCFGAWTWCSAGDVATNKFWWNLGWCVAGNESGSNPQSPQQCMALMGTPLQSNFRIPGYSSAARSSSGVSSASGGASSGGGGQTEGGGGQQPGDQQPGDQQPGDQQPSDPGGVDCGPGYYYCPKYGGVCVLNGVAC